MLTGSRPFQTERSFQLPGGRAMRTFTLRERSGVILFNRLDGAARGPGARRGADPRARRCARDELARRATTLRSRAGGTGLLEVCTQGEEWCPMPQATWPFRLVKLSGPAGAVRFDYVVAPPPSQALRGVAVGRPLGQPELRGGGSRRRLAGRRRGSAARVGARRRTSLCRGSGGSASSARCRRARAGGGTGARSASRSGGRRGCSARRRGRGRRAGGTRS